MSKKTKTPKAAKATPRRWSLGLFKNKDGALVTIYVRVDGTPVPYLKKSVVGKALFHAVYTDMTYSQARRKLLADAGIREKKAVKGKKSPTTEAPQLKKAA